MSPTLVVQPDAESLARAAADWLCVRLEAKLGKAAVALSGGSTPKRLYETLASAEYRERVPWERVHWFWGDERFVPPNDPQSNFAMFERAVLRRAPVPAQNVHAIPTVGLTTAAAAQDYQGELRRFYGAGTLRDDEPLFEVVLLGLGDDGHVASLLPGSAVLDERSAWVAPVETGRPEPRITLTYPALQSCRDCLFIVAGAAKKAVVAAVLRGENFPATRLKPCGATTWFVDRAAAPEEDPKVRSGDA